MRTTIILSMLLYTGALRAQDTLPGHGPRISFDHVLHTYGSIAHGSDGRCAFTFTNTGDAPLVISQCRSSCGCVVPDWDREPVAPGGKGQVRVRYDTHRVGPFSKSVTVQSNALDHPEVVLTIKGEVGLPASVPDSLPVR